MERVRGVAVGEALSHGFEGMKRRLGLLVGIFLISLGISLVMNLLVEAARGRSGAIAFLLSLAGQGVQIALGAGWIRIALLVERGQRASVRDLVPTGTQFVRFLGASVLYSLLVTLGFILLIVPGIYVAIRYGAYGFLVIDRGLDPVASLRESAALTSGVKWDLLAFGLVLAGINLIGALTFGIGLVFTLPVTALAAAHVYEGLRAGATLPRPFPTDQPQPTPV